MQANANFALDTANGLLKSFGKEWTWFLNANGILKLATIVIEHL
ncbi:hypothetical protein RBSH_05658 [Rhodopirellula baltica SH28]|uniref:Uncharacterized protein n=1 Tax=Rhodopirellula baltica SH28 TaxID=993517 RepID=K5D9D1_RHOBT|nr:hypothetical protein RBSH_05658 [Rhodopirellula baltica SH28]